MLTRSLWRELRACADGCCQPNFETLTYCYYGSRTGSVRTEASRACMDASPSPLAFVAPTSSPILVLTDTFMATTVVVEPSRVYPARFWTSTNGKKAVMAVTGFILILFVIGHMLGNLQTFEGPAKLNAYGHFLHSVPEILWAVRMVLIICVVLHIVASIQLALRKTEARPVGYARRQNVASSYASRTMYWSGPILLAFIVYHLLHLTAGVIHPGSTFIEGDVYHNVVTGFQVWWVSAWYVFSMVLLGLHLRHGAWSMFQSLGFNHPRHTPILKKAAWVFAIVIAGGYISIPVAVMLGAVR